MSFRRDPSKTLSATGRFIPDPFSRHSDGRGIDIMDRDVFRASGSNSNTETTISDERSKSALYGVRFRSFAHRSRSSIENLYGERENDCSEMYIFMQYMNERCWVQKNELPRSI